MIIATLALNSISIVQGAEIETPSIPYERFRGQVQQQSKNMNRSLFQKDTMGDLGKKRNRAMGEAYRKAFQHSYQSWNPKKTLFHTNTYRSKDYTNKKVNNKKSSSHYGRFSFIVVVIGTVLSILSIRRGKKQCLN